MDAVLLQLRNTTGRFIEKSLRHIFQNHITRQLTIPSRCHVGDQGVDRLYEMCRWQSSPTDRAAAMQLVWEQYWCYADIVEQDCGVVTGLAATRLKSPYWYFWWD